MYTAAITGTGVFTPSETITNAELVEAYNAYADRINAENAEAIAAGSFTALPQSSEEFIFKASGIEQRYVLDKKGILDPEIMYPQLRQRDDSEPGIMAEIALDAAKKALKQAGKTAEDVDLVICAASNMERAYPAVAIEIQDLLGIKGFAFDMNVACSSATFGLQQASDMIKSGSARKVLMVNPEITSGHLEWRDRDCHFIFGDACTAIVVERMDEAKSDHVYEVVGTNLKTVFSNNIRNNFGFLNRCDESGQGNPDKLFIQQGRKVFKEVVPMVASIIGDHLQENNLSPDQLKRMWLHQANLSMNKLISKKVLGRDPSSLEAPVILDEYANTSSAGSIIAYHKHKEDIQEGDIGVICSFGAGYSVGSILLRKCS